MTKNIKIHAGKKFEHSFSSSRLKILYTTTIATLNKTLRNYKCYSITLNYLYHLLRIVTISVTMLSVSCGLYSGFYNFLGRFVYHFYNVAYYIQAVASEQISLLLKKCQYSRISRISRNPSRLIDCFISKFMYMGSFDQHKRISRTSTTPITRKKLTSFLLRLLSVCLRFL